MAEEKSARGNSSQFFVAGELCRRGLVAAVTLGNCPNTDILCSNIKGTKFVHIQVKTFVPGNKTCPVGRKAEQDFGEKFFWVLSGIPHPEQDVEFEYYIIPSVNMAKHVYNSHKLWMETPGKNGRAHQDSTSRVIYISPEKVFGDGSIAEYKNRWDLIEEKLKD